MMRPVMLQVFLLIPVLYSLCRVDAAAGLTRSSEPFWQFENEWSNCSAACGPGHETRPLICASFSHEMTLKVQPVEKCDGKEKPATMQRQCNLGSCDSLYRWRPTSWSSCSQQCGMIGTMSREVDCVYSRDGEEQILANEDETRFCPMETRPSDEESCNRVDCGPQVLPGEWGKCMQTDPCETGRQNREIKCTQQLANGTIRHLPKRVCVNLKIHIDTWQPCFIASLSEQCKTQPAQIEMAANKTIVQIQKGSPITLQVGEEAFIIPFTKVTVKCPVKFFASQDLNWVHDIHGRLSYVGHSVERITVDKDGNLLIKHFKLADRGQWKCIAGDSSAATVTLMARSPAEAYLDRSDRSQKSRPGSVNDRMMNEDPKKIVQTAESQIKWFTGPWSKCTTECGVKSMQTRMVRCEELGTRIYQVLNDSVCIDRLMQKPATDRDCNTRKECPRWEWKNITEAACSMNCQAPGKASLTGDLECRVKQEVVPDEECNKIVKPLVDCVNPLCEIEWKVSEWGSCSNPCGGLGTQARTIVCKWQHDGSLAGSLCVDRAMQIPEVVRPCEVTNCRLDCINLSTYCDKQKHLCHLNTFRFNCCKTCRDLFIERKKAAEKQT